ncbi:MAG: hypothetical protein E6J90_04425 [Deltaproteobacteria bacterium]|nr:MAG: hypothetical protein E6J91_01600 [Deltaproteobacteria bacterium]TMQ26434.1 MAG: hypothetical protein E6J90_04425 [Deltaproteobacteria bacterium]
MGTPARRDELLDQVLALPIEDRDYIEAALVREAYEQGRTDTPEEVSEIAQRASDTLSERSTGFSREASVARARAAVEAVRARKP